MSIRLMSEVWERGPAGMGEKFVLLALADYANEHGECWPSVATLSRKCSIGERGIRLILRRLETQGWLETSLGGGRGGASRYRIVIPSGDKADKPVKEKKTAVNAPRQEVPRGTKVHETRQEVPPNLQEPSSSYSTRAEEPREPSEPRGFSAFWNAYGHKKAVGAARRAYGIAIKRASPETIIEGARVYALTRNPQFVKNAATWLNGECWADDPLTNARKEPPNGRRNVSDPGFEARLAKWDQLDARLAGEPFDAGTGEPDDGGGAAFAGVDRSQGFGASVALFRPRFG